CNADRAEAVVRREDGARDVRAVAEHVTRDGILVRLARDERGTQTGVEVRGDVGVIRVDTVVKDGDADTCAARARSPGLRRVDRVVTPLKVEEEVVVTAGGRVTELVCRDSFTPRRVDPLPAHIGQRRLDAADAGSLCLEVRIGRAYDRHTDLRDNPLDRAADC